MLPLYLLLKLISIISTERSVTAIFHILLGKKSMQTMSDMFLFRVSSYYRVIPSLSEDVLMKTYQDAVHRRFIRVDRDRAQLTEEGKKELIELQNKYTYALYLDDARNDTDIQAFWSRLQLFVQLLSNEGAKSKHWKPIVNDYYTQQWLKYYYYHYRSDTWREEVYEELKEILSGLRTHEAEAIVLQLTSAQTMGQTLYQLAPMYEVSEEYEMEFFTYCLLVQMKESIKKRDEQSHLKQFIHSVRYKSITMTAQETWRMYCAIGDVSEIARRRRLKENTIQDHLIEIATYNEGFPFTNFMTTNNLKEIHHVIEQLQTETKREGIRLMEIKERVHEQLSYFQIRLGVTYWRKQKDEQK